MRIEVAGAQITDAVVETLDTLQNQQGYTRLYIDTIDRLTRSIISYLDEDDDPHSLSQLRILQMLRRDLCSLAFPPDVDSPDNDTPTASF